MLQLFCFLEMGGDRDSWSDVVYGVGEFCLSQYVFFFHGTLFIQI